MRQILFALGIACMTLHAGCVRPHEPTGGGGRSPWGSGEPNPINVLEVRDGGFESDAAARAKPHPGTIERAPLPIIESGEDEEGDTSPPAP